MLSKFHLTKYILIGFMVIAATGCGRSDRVPVYPVKGTVTFNDKPMIGGGAISFIPDEGQKGKAAGGTIKDDGTYELTTYVQGDGSMPGKFRVVVQQIVVDEPENTGDSDEGGAADGPESVELVGEEDRIPHKYASPATTPLTVTVEEKSQNEINIELER